MKLLIIPFAILAAIAILEIVAIIVLKLPISEKKLDKFFAKHLESYKKTRMDDNCSMFYGLSEKPYISKFPVPLILGSWCFGNDLGRIPRWSKWNRVLNDLQKLNKMSGRGIEKYL